MDPKAECLHMNVKSQRASLWKIWLTIFHVQKIKSDENIITEWSF